MKANAIAWGAAVAVLQAASAGAQQKPISVQGTIYDSLRGQPMRNAFVSIAGRSQVTTTDSKGRFQFDSVEPGVQRIVAQHPVLDSIGLSGLSARASVTDGSHEVLLAVPSFATLWRAACTARVPKDSGIVYGTVRDARRGGLVANAMIDLSWVDLVLDKGRVHERRWHIETRTNDRGEYSACGVAPDLGFQLQASFQGRETGRIELPPFTMRVQRHNLLVGGGSGDGATGTVSGTVTDASGNAITDARVEVDSFPEVRTGTDGTFLVSHVPTGTRRVKVSAIGAFPASVAVDVLPGNVSPVSVTARPATMLAPVETRAERNVRVFKAEFAERRRLGFGYVRDSSEIARYDQFLSVLRDVPSMTVQYRSSTSPGIHITVPDGAGGQCAPLVMIDGAGAEFGHLVDLQPNEVAAVEVYVRAAHVPARYVPVGLRPQCGMILVWTKYGMRNR